MEALIQQKFGFIGPGKMAEAIVNGIISGSLLSSANLYIYGRSKEKVAHFAELGCKPCMDLAEMSQECAVIFLCIKPQNFLEVTENLKPMVSNNILYVSIAAGLSSTRIREMLGAAVKLVRVMPNTPLLIGQGATAISSTANVSETEISTICNVFASCGMVARIDEALMDPIIAVSGSSPAYLYLFAKHVCAYAVEKGVDHQTATQLFGQTLIGAGHMLLETGLTPDALIAMVASKGGTTQAALNVLEQDGFGEILYKAMDACVKRAQELGKS